MGDAELNIDNIIARLLEGKDYFDCLNFYKCGQWNFVFDIDILYQAGIFHKNWFLLNMNTPSKHVRLVISRLVLNIDIASCLVVATKILMIQMLKY